MGGRGGGGGNGGGGARERHFDFTSSDDAPAVLNRISSRAEAKRYLGQASWGQLRRVTSALGISGQGNKEALIDRIVEFTVGNRLNSAAIRRL